MSRAYVRVRGPRGPKLNFPVLRRAWIPGRKFAPARNRTKPTYLSSRRLGRVTGAIRPDTRPPGDRSVPQEGFRHEERIPAPRIPAPGLRHRRWLPPIAAAAHPGATVRRLQPALGPTTPPTARCRLDATGHIRNGASTSSRAPPAGPSHTTALPFHARADPAAPTTAN